MLFNFLCLDIPENELEYIIQHQEVSMITLYKDEHLILQKFSDLVS